MAVLEREIDDVERAEAAAPAEDVLRAAVVLLRVEAEALRVVVEREAGQRARRLADVLLRVAVVRAQREQLEELAREVLVRRLVARAGEVEPDLHRAVAHHGARQRAEVAERVAAQRALLAHHQLDVADLVVRGRPVVVPVEASCARPADGGRAPCGRATRARPARTGWRGSAGRPSTRGSGPSRVAPRGCRNSCTRSACVRLPRRSRGRGPNPARHHSRSIIAASRVASAITPPSSRARRARSASPAPRDRRACTPARSGPAAGAPAAGRVRRVGRPRSRR